MTETGPYATAADIYWRAGWRGILPLPARAKKNPPKGYTGDGGIYPSYPDLDAWATGPERLGNIALRMPAGVIGIDVDAYGDKPGAETLRLAEAAHGTLPPTWRTTSRDDGVSGIRLYRVPESLAWPGEIGPATEIIQARHRYAIVWPSVHPEGRTYRWISPDGLVSTGVPDPDELAALPEEWIEAYTGGALATSTARVDVKHAEAVAWVAGRDHATDDMCRRMEKALDQFAHDLVGSAHNSTRDAVLRIARLADEGHHGAVHALASVRRDFLADATSANRTILGKARRTEGEAVYEFNDLVASAVGVVVANPTGLATCDCFGQITGLLTTSTTAPPATPTAATVDGTNALAPQPAPTPATGGVDTTPDETEQGHRFKDGASFILDTPEALPNIWGDGDESLWAEGEALMICGPPGVGKTTLTGQVVRGLLGLQDEVLGLPVRHVDRRVLYLAMDRPAQIARGLRRTFHEADRPTLRDRLMVWEGPPPGDVARHPTVLLSLAELAEADVIVIDSVKDAAIGLTEDETAAAYNRARQTALAAGVQVLELHHMVKRGANGAKPKELADVYGSAWLTAGAGSVALLWGAAGDPVVEFVHLKQPAGEVGPWRLEHDHAAGTTRIFSGADLLSIVAGGGHFGVTPTDAAKVMFGTDAPSDAEKVKARRSLKRLVEKGAVETYSRERDVYSGGKDQTYYRVPIQPVDNSPNPNEHPNDTPSRRRANNTNDTPTTPDHVSAGQPNEHPNDANDAGGPTTPAPVSIKTGRVDPGSEATSELPLQVACVGCFKPIPQHLADSLDGRCSNCAWRAGLR